MTEPTIQPGPGVAEAVAVQLAALDPGYGYSPYEQSLRQRLATVRALHPRWPDGLCPRCRVDWPCETAEAVGE